jgi:hypothetical protein
MHLLFILLLLASCGTDGNWGFFQPINMELNVPKGPPEFKAGWYAGCRSALSQNAFYNSSFFYKDGGTPNFGSGIYQNNPVYQSAWSQAYFNCMVHAATFNRDRYISNRNPLR